MSVGAVDSGVLGGLFATDAMRAAFADDARLARMLEVEAALARVQGRLGVIPEAAAREIAAQAQALRPDPAALRDGTARTGYPIVPLVKALAAACAGDAGGWVHWGATTQDIIDTAVVLQVRDGLALVDQDLAALDATLAALARAHRATAMPGRTHLQQALPITFGLKCAGWLAPLRRHRRRLDELRPRVLVVQFFGAAGTLASLGDDGLAVMEGLAAELGLGAPEIGWHTARDGFAETVCFLGLVTGTLAKIATDVSLLMQSEVDEAREPYLPGRGGSSTMPQKRNPIACELVLACALSLRQLVPVMLGAMQADHERATGPWHAEWLALPQAFALASGALHHARVLLEGLEVDPARMRANLELTRGMIAAEAVMMALAPHLGRQEAHHVVADACRAAAADGRHLLDVLGGVPAVTRHLSRERLAALLDPVRYTGQASALVYRVLAAATEP